MLIMYNRSSAFFTVISIIVPYIITIQETSFFSSKFTQFDEENAAEDIYIIDVDEDEGKIEIDT